MFDMFDLGPMYDNHFLFSIVDLDLEHRSLKCELVHGTFKVCSQYPSSEHLYAVSPKSVEASTSMAYIVKVNKFFL